jgi:hypothetical protein
MGGAYQITFNDYRSGYFILEKFDPLGRTTLLEIPELFPGLNHLVLEDRGRSITVTINGINYGTVDVTALTRPTPGYMVLITGDLGGCDYFDYVKVSVAR